MKEIPILFKSEMVRAILQGNKTQTRRILKEQPFLTPSGMYSWKGLLRDMRINPTTENGTPIAAIDQWPEAYKYKARDLLWVKETFWRRPHMTKRDLILGGDTWPKYVYDADNAVPFEELKEYKFKHVPSIFMPRAASRILLRILSVRIERLQNITEQDAQAEGAKKDRVWGMGAIGEESYREGFRLLWESINAARGFGWNKNPFVYRIEFKKVIECRSYQK